MIRNAWHRFLVLSLMAFAAIGLGFTTAAPAQASPWDSHVHVKGHVDCGGIDSAKWMWWWTDTESGFAELSEWTSISRVASKIAPEFGWVKVMEYNLDLQQVPGDGVTLHYRIGCANSMGDVPPFEQSFGVNRPALGTSATRHVCLNNVLGCTV